MDSKAIAALTAFSTGMVGENGETLETIQTERVDQEAARKALLDGLRPRLEAANRTIRWAADIMAEAYSGGRESSRAESYRLDEAANAWLRLVANFEASPDPEAFVIDLEETAEEARQEADEERERQSQHRPRPSRRY